MLADSCHFQCRVHDAQVARIQVSTAHASLQRRRHPGCYVGIYAERDWKRYAAHLPCFSFLITVIVLVTRFQAPVGFLRASWSPIGCSNFNGVILTILTTEGVVLLMEPLKNPMLGAWRTVLLLD